MSELTIAIPFVNAMPWLADAVRSVFAQTFADWELLLVDDGSTDGSLAVATAVQDPRVRVVSDGVNRGLSARLNQIADLARSPLLARMDADDLMDPQRLEIQVGYLRSNPAMDLVCTAMAILDESNRVVGIRRVAPDSFDRRTAFARAILTHATVAGRTAWFRKHRYSESLRRAEDHELWYRTVEESRFAALSEPLYFCRDVCASSYPKYRASCRATRCFYWRDGPATVGWAGTLGLVLRSYAKQGIYRLAAVAGQEHRVQGRRNQAIGDPARSEIERALDRIARSEVPGLSGAPMMAEAPR